MFKKILIKALGEGVRKGTLRITFSDGTHYNFGMPCEGYPDVRVRYIDENVPRDIVLRPDPGMAEVHMNGRSVMEQGSIMDMMELLRSNHRYEDTMGKRKWRGQSVVLTKLIFQMQQFNNRLKSHINVAHHYDIGNDLYEIMLDPEHMQYSCGFWPRDEMTLGEAQEAKLAHIASKLALEPGHQVLDIGCGWGGMAIFLASRFDVQVTGITLSEEQLELARCRAAKAGLTDRVKFELVDYRELAGQGRAFDRVVSVGMFEHVGRPQFDTFFACCRDLLTPAGVMLLHTIGRMGSPGVTDRFTSKYIFPGGYIPSLSETMAASERSGLIPCDIEVLRVHYAKTIQRWYDNCQSNREAIIAMYDERFFRMWEVYLAGAATVFKHGGMCNFQIQYTRDRNVLPLTRSYMAAAEDMLSVSLKNGSANPSTAATVVGTG